MTEVSELKACPFCGSSAHYFFDRNLSPAKNEREWAICDGCNAAEPVSVWTRRSPSRESVLRKDQHLAVAICSLLASTPPKDWLSKDAIHAALIEFRQSSLSSPNPQGK